MASLPDWGLPWRRRTHAPRGTHNLRFGSTRRPWAGDNPCYVRVSLERVPGIERAWPGCRSDPGRGGGVQVWYMRPR